MFWRLQKNIFFWKLGNLSAHRVHFLKKILQPKKTRENKMQICPDLEVGQLSKK